MESAIPQHLKKKRTCPRNLVDNNYLPPFPAWTTRFETNIEKLTVAYFAIQSTNQIQFSEHELFTKYFKEENHLNIGFLLILLINRNTIILLLLHIGQMQKNFSSGGSLQDSIYGGRVKSGSSIYMVIF
ncbi:hypothetical protein [Acinetobacter nectaris]|uniref:hypothetical protein n=1 Tax=Acinetobacter nectaris TaxID=1219382 RepID=UPI001F38DC61|nr:hypothetical protein [Acinetobacter nectaris]